MVDLPLLRTPLNAVHRQLGGRLVDFAGWEMPVQYPTGIVAEHLAVRQDRGLFDLSHMGRVSVRGRHALALAQWCVTRDLALVPEGGAAYALLCNEHGGILDDVIAYRLEPEEILFVFNASNRLSDIDWFERQADARHLDVTIEDRTLATALIGVQGPTAATAVQPLCDASLEPVPGYRFIRARVAGAEALVARTGYTGEDGFELLVDADAASAVWDALLGHGSGSAPCGLGARDTLRTEAAMPLYGHEIGENNLPYEARLGWVVNLDKPDFVGKAALVEAQKSPRSRLLVGLAVGEGGVPRPGLEIHHGGSVVGSLTSGTFSPTLRRPIALGYVPPALAAAGTGVTIALRGKQVTAQVVKLPFVAHRTRPRPPAPAK